MLRQVFRELAICAILGLILGLAVAWVQQRLHVEPKIIKTSFLIVGMTVLAYSIFVLYKFIQAVKEDDDWYE